MNMFWGLPDFLWNNIFTLLTTLVCGLIVAYFTSTFLKKKEERTRVAGVILEKRIESEQEIVRFLDKQLFKMELNQGNSSLHDRDIQQLLESFAIESPYGNRIQYAKIFTGREIFEKFFHEYEELITSNRLWMENKVRKHLLYIQLYFSCINSIPLCIKRIPLPKEYALTDEEFSEVCNQILFLYGVALDEEINGLLTKLDELVVDSVYRLDLRRPKRSVLRDRMFNPDMTKLLKKIMRETILGSEKRKFFELMMTLVYQKKDFDEDKLSDEEFNNFYQEWYPEEFAKMEAQRAIYEEMKKGVSDKKNTKPEL